jgi:hypothetical protein
VVGHVVGTDPKWREGAVKIVAAFEAHAKLGTAGRPRGYSPVTAVDTVDPVPKANAAMPSWFLAETLKYLYLIFREDEYFSFDEYVFNTEAHPFKIQRTPPTTSSTPTRTTRTTASGGSGSHGNRTADDGWPWGRADQPTEATRPRTDDGSVPSPGRGGGGGGGGGGGATAKKGNPGPSTTRTGVAVAAVVALVMAVLVGAVVWRVRRARLANRRDRDNIQATLALPTVDGGWRGSGHGEGSTRYTDNIPIIVSTEREALSGGTVGLRGSEALVASTLFGTGATARAGSAGTGDGGDSLPPGNGDSLPPGNGDSLPAGKSVSADTGDDADSPLLHDVATHYP